MSAVKSIPGSRLLHEALESDNPEKCVTILTRYNYEQCNDHEVGSPIFRAIELFRQKKECCEAILKWCAAQETSELQRVMGIEDKKPFTKRCTYALFQRFEDDQRKMLPMLKNISGVWKRICSDFNALKGLNSSLWAENTFLQKEIQITDLSTQKGAGVSENKGKTSEKSPEGKGQIGSLTTQLNETKIS